VPNPQLYLQLRQWRDEQCRQKNLPVYLVVANSSLRGICEWLPVNNAELMEVPGFGAAKATKYGPAITEMVQDYCDRHQVDKSQCTPPAGRRRKKSPVPRAEKTPSAQISLQMYHEGKSIAAIARERKLAPGTIEGHLVDSIGKGLLSLDRFVAAEALQSIGACMDAHPGKTVAEWVNLLNNVYSYNQVKAVLLHRQGLQEPATT
jgi:hypothetical protein